MVCNGEDMNLSHTRGKENTMAAATSSSRIPAGLTVIHPARVRALIEHVHTMLHRAVPVCLILD